MIKNSLKYTKNYYNLSDKIKTALIFLEENNLNNFKNGKYLIDGDDIYINIQDYNTKPVEDGKWEAHKKYIDIQYIIEGSENIGVGEIQDFTVSEIYNKENDVEFLKTDNKQQFILLNKNDYIILYPYDVHMPQIKNENSQYVKKAVVKISI